MALKTQKRSTIALLSMSAVLVFAVGTAAPAALTNPPLNPESAGVSLPSYERVCEQRAINVCVHPAYEVLLPETATTVAEMTKPLAGVAGGPVRATQVPSQPAGLRQDGTLEFTYTTKHLSTTKFKWSWRTR